MHAQNVFMTLLLSTLTAALAAAPQETEFEVLDRYMFPIRKAFAEYNSKSEDCEKTEKKKPPLQVSDINFLNQRQAQVMMLREQRRRLSACIYLEENIVIRKHLEVLNLFRSENIFPEDAKALVEALDLYFGLQSRFDRNTQKDYELIPENLRKQFYRVVKDKGLEVNAFEITDSLPE